MAPNRFVKLLTLFLVLPVGCLLVSSARPAALETITMYADRDTYLSYNNDHTNYGGLSYMLFANYLGDWSHGWIHFNLTGLPAEYIEVTLFVNVYGVSQTFHPRLFTYTQASTYNPYYDWGEYSITYYTMPQLSDGHMQYFTCDTDRIYSFNVTDVIRTRTNLTAGLSANFQPAETVEAGYGYISSRESGTGPRLVVSYMVGGPDPDPLPWEWIAGGIALVAIGIVLGIAFNKMIPRFSEWRRSRREARQPPSLLLCPMCYNEFPPGTGICPHCGQRVPR